MARTGSDSRSASDCHHRRDCQCLTVQPEPLAPCRARARWVPRDHSAHAVRCLQPLALRTNFGKSIARKWSSLALAPFLVRHLLPWLAPQAPVHTPPSVAAPAVRVMATAADASALVHGAFMCTEPFDVAFRFFVGLRRVDAQLHLEAGDDAVEVTERCKRSRTVRAQPRALRGACWIPAGSLPMRMSRATLPPPCVAQSCRCCKRTWRTMSQCCKAGQLLYAGSRGVG